ncbi:hypothetical protein TSAR_013955 [Trichomalopsis sarcophagae]|uniref:Uncharacterized protein n=1 Tax=Trichomalopsis sarcophagae TaxID=543379 RepID=A0A232FC77_9HYME|nr:hypothetical protein TSAR_013955 [Trichomalopsis sarcophagae]
MDLSLYFSLWHLFVFKELSGVCYTKGQI